MSTTTDTVIIRRAGSQDGVALNLLAMLDSQRPLRGPVPVAEVREVAVEDGAPERDPGLWAAVGALPPKQRAAVALRYGSDLPHDEIAAALGCSPEAARRSLHEGLKRLRKELA